ncbi:hypothetical protein PIB30_103212, partial [Stylosanthes scabra]|nr:hypothetical protein [Stylosanthes scabra]
NSKNNYQNRPPLEPFQRPPFQPPFPQQPKPTSTQSFEAALEKLTLTTAGFVQSTNQFIEEARSNFRNQESSIRNLETQVGQIAKQLSTPFPKSFPSNTQDNPKGECKFITLRSEKTLEDTTKKVDAQATIENAMEEYSKKQDNQQQ